MSTHLNVFPFLSLTLATHRTFLTAFSCHPLSAFPAEAQVPTRKDHRALNVGEADEALISLLLSLLSVKYILKPEHFLHVISHPIDDHLLLQQN